MKLRKTSTKSDVSFSPKYRLMQRKKHEKARPDTEAKYYTLNATTWMHV